MSTPPDTEIKDAEINDAEESQSLFSSAELPSDQPTDQPSDQPSDESPPVPPSRKKSLVLGICGLLVARFPEDIQLRCLKL